MGRAARSLSLLAYRLKFCQSAARALPPSADQNLEEWCDVIRSIVQTVPSANLRQYALFVEFVGNRRLAFV